MPKAEWLSLAGGVELIFNFLHFAYQYFLAGIKQVLNLIEAVNLNNY